MKIMITCMEHDYNTNETDSYEEDTDTEYEVRSRQLESSKIWNLKRYECLL